MKQITQYFLEGERPTLSLFFYFAFCEILFIRLSVTKLEGCENNVKTPHLPVLFFSPKKY